MIDKQLEPYLKHKSAKAKVVLYLLAKGYDYQMISDLKIKDLREMINNASNIIQLPIKELLEEVSNREDIDNVFTYDNGRRFGKEEAKRILYSSTSKVDGEKKTISEFRAMFGGDDKCLQ